MAVTAEQRERFYAATANAKALLKQGDRIQAGRCGGIVASYTFMGWHGHWIVSATGIDDIAATHIRKVNGEPVTF